MDSDMDDHDDYGSDSDDMYGSDDDDNLSAIMNGGSSDDENEFFSLNPDRDPLPRGDSGDTNDSWEDIEVQEENL